MKSNGFRAFLFLGIFVVAGALFFVLDGRVERAIPEDEEKGTGLFTSTPVVLDKPIKAERIQRTRTLKEQQSVTIEVLRRSSGNPIAGVSIASDDGAKMTFLGITNDLGILETQVQDRSGVREIIAKSDTYASRAFFLPNGLPPQYTLRLERGFRVIGRVYFGRESHAGPDIHVFAWPITRPPLEESIHRYANSRPGTLLSTTTGPDGRFELSGLDEKETYTLLAAGNGYLSSLSGPEVQVSQVEASLEIYPIYGALICLEANQQNLRTQGLPDRAVSFGKSGQGDIERLDSMNLMLLFAGIPSTKEHHRKFEFPLYYLRKDGVTGTFVHHLQVHIPGYERVSAGVQFSAIANGLSKQIVCLVPMGGGEGRLEVQFHSAADIKYPNREQTVIGEFVLTRKGSRKREESRYGVHDFSKPIRLSGLPVGDYQYAFLLKDRRGIGLDEYDHFAGEVQLCPDELSTIRMDVSSLGAVEIKLYFDSEMQWNNATIFRVHGEGPGTKIGEYCFSRGPYVIRGLPQGKYRVVVHEPINGSRKGFAQSELFSITGGITASISRGLGVNWIRQAVEKPQSSITQQLTVWEY